MFFNIYNFACFCQDRMSNLRERIAKQFLRLKIFKFHFVHFNSLCLRFRWIKQNALILWILYMFARAHYNISKLIKSNLYQHVGRHYTKLWTKNEGIKIIIFVASILICFCPWVSQARGGRNWGMCKYRKYFEYLHNKYLTW